MIPEITAIIISACVVYFIGRPIVNWIHNAKKEMEEQHDGTE